MIGTDVCACGCGEPIVQTPGKKHKIYHSRPCWRRAETARQRTEAEAVKAERSALFLPAPEVAPGISLPTGPVPKLCGLCPMQSRRGNHPCTHQRLAVRWINEPASEARIHGAYPWGRLEVKA